MLIVSSKSSATTHGAPSAANGVGVRLLTPVPRCCRQQRYVSTYDHTRIAAGRNTALPAAQELELKHGEQKKATALLLQHQTGRRGLGVAAFHKFAPWR